MTLTAAEEADYIVYLIGNLFLNHFKVHFLKVDLDFQKVIALIKQRKKGRLFIVFALKNVNKGFIFHFSKYGIKLQAKYQRTLTSAGREKCSADSGWCGYEIPVQFRENSRVYNPLTPRH